MVVQVKRIAVLGSTGSIGRQTLDVVRSMSKYFRVVGLAAGDNLDLLAEQVNEFLPAFVSYKSTVSNKKLLERFQATRGDFLSMEEMASHPDIDTVVIAVSGAAGLGAALAAAKAGKNIALANKESLVAAGAIITTIARKTGAKILPVDSEHSAIWQCLAGEKQPPRRIILTASGGPFRGYSLEKMKKITVEQALAHPSWKMGTKVTIDSATLMNKGLEVIEAKWLFNVPVNNVKVLIHPQSVVHSMVEFADGSVKAQLSIPDMRLPIQYALAYPDRLPNPELPYIDWTTFSDLVFEQPDMESFPCLRLGIEAGKKGGTYPAVLCAADEVAVDLFLAHQIGFLDIPRLIIKTLEKHTGKMNPTINTIKAADLWARRTIMEIAERKRR